MARSCSTRSGVTERRLDLRRTTRDAGGSAYDASVGIAQAAAEVAVVSMWC